ncbi:MAG: protein kinase [Planctomycetota bacterium]
MNAPQQIGAYLVQEEIARGAMGVVYRARGRGGQDVALKVLLDPGQTHASERFRREVAIVARLSHEHILPVLDVGAVNGLPFLVMPYVPGESLRERMKRGGPLDPRDAAEVVARIARAVAHAHELGVLHRDIKPGNVLIHPGTGEPLLIDFGAARLEGAQRLTLTGASLGTPGYMAPEQAAGEEATERTDVYGLGALLYALLSGKAPFEGATAANIYTAILTRGPTPLSESADAAIPAGLEAIVMRCLARSPADRFPSAVALAEALEDYLEGKVAGSGAGRRRPWLVLGGALLVAASLALFGATRSPVAAVAPGPSSPATTASTPAPASSGPEPAASASSLPSPPLERRASPSPLPTPSRTASTPASAPPVERRIAWAQVRAETGAPFGVRASGGLAPNPGGGLVLFGGTQGNATFPAETWVRRKGTWTQAANGGPRPRRSFGLCATPGGSVLLWGGERIIVGPMGRPAIRVFDDLWRWDGSQWSEVPVEGARPPARSHAGLVALPGDGLLLFGGRDGRGTLLGDTWRFDGRGWTELHPAPAPEARRNHAMAFDPDRGAVVLFGGMALRGRLFDDTWELEGETWSRREVALSPPPRRAPGGMTYDPRLKAVLLFGGNGEGQRKLADTWTFDGHTWREHPSVAAPGARDWVQLAYDPDTERVVLLGGELTIAGRDTPIDDVWEAQLAD